MQITITAGLIAMDGMKTVEEWGQLGRCQRARHLATLDAMGLRGQASVLAAAQRATLEYVLGGWVASGYVGHARAIEAMMAEPQATLALK